MADDGSLDSAAIGGTAGSPLNITPSLGSSSSLFSSPLSIGAAGVGALGLGALIAQGPGSLPSQFGQADTNATWQAGAGQQQFGQGQQLVQQGTNALQMAEQGQLTPEQQAQINVYGSGLTNAARQQFYNMGTNPDQNTAFLGAQEDIATHVNAMAQQQIQSTIALGLGELSTGSSLESAGTGNVSAANNTLIAAGQAQLKQDQQYSSNLSSAFSAIGTLFGAAVGGPAGAAVGGAAGKLVGGVASS